MKPLLLASLLWIALSPAAAGAHGGTLHFRGALVETTCETEVMDAQPLAGHLAVRLHACLLPGSPSGRAPTGEAPQVNAALQTVELVGPVAAMAGRRQVEAVTLEYQ